MPLIRTTNPYDMEQRIFDLETKGSSSPVGRGLVSIPADTNWNLQNILDYVVEQYEAGNKITSLFIPRLSFQFSSEQNLYHGLFTETEGKITAASEGFRGADDVDYGVKISFVPVTDGTNTYYPDVQMVNNTIIVEYTETTTTIRINLNIYSEKSYIHASKFNGYTANNYSNFLKVEYGTPDINKITVGGDINSQNYASEYLPFIVGGAQGSTNNYNLCATYSKNKTSGTITRGLTYSGLYIHIEDIRDWFFYKRLNGISSENYMEPVSYFLNSNRRAVGVTDGIPYISSGSSSNTVSTGLTDWIISGVGQKPYDIFYDYEIK
jgi:hypothetical protein